MLASIMRKVRLPDMEFIWNLGDWPLAVGNRSHYPVISWCKDDKVNDILLPTYKLVEGTIFGKQLENVVKVDGESYEAGGEWEDRDEVLFFRGRDSNPVRVAFADGIAKENRHIIDARLSKNEFNYYPSEEARQADKDSGMYYKKVARRDFKFFFRNK